MNVLLTLQFDGTAFFGWQVQPVARTVQATLTRAIVDLVGHPVTVYGSSRTDSGVHAEAFPANFLTTREIPPRGLMLGLNARLPEDLAVTSAREVPEDFRTRYAAVAKTYTYRFQLGDARRPLGARYRWFVKRRHFDIAAMNRAAARMVGDHDFSAFRSKHCTAGSSHRRIYALTVSAPDDEDVVTLTITGNAFLRYMVRIIAGTLAEVGIGRRDPASIDGLLATGERALSGQTAPGCGLTLTQVHFEGYPRLGKVDALSPGAVPS